MTGLANHLWQSTLFAAAASVLALALRHERAQVRYRLWLAASLKFLVPFSLLIALGSRLDWRVPSSAAPASPAIPAAVEQFAQPFDSPATTPPRAPAFYWPAALWLCGSAFVSARWYRRWRRIHVALRASSSLPIRAGIDVRSSATRLEPGVFGILRPVLLLPKGIAARLTPAQLDAILSHELCHVRRRDNLWASLHMLVEAVFWFHPLVWWIGARLVEERERACDEEVLSSGREPQVYAEGILRICRLYLESGLSCASGVTGADLKQRIEAIMINRTLSRLTLPRKFLLASMAIAAIAAPVAIGVLDAPRLRAQSTPLRFEVASVKPFSGGGGKAGLEILPGGGLRMEGVTLKALITLAYGVHDEQISGGAPWTGTEGYEILAKPERSEAADNPQYVVAPGTTAWNRLEQRLQSLLEERFRLQIHKTYKDQQGYALVLAKNGPKLPPSAAGDQRPPGTMRGPGRIDGRNGTMTMLATVLANLVGRPVEDRTGLTGTYTYKLEYRQERQDMPDAAPPDPAAPSVFTALQEQLGLKLDSARVRQETIVIDRAEKPAAN